jgi:hypothetical protein
MDKSIMPECYADTLLIQTLVPTKIGYNHQHSCFKVEGEMRLGRLMDQFALGIIDKDKETIGYIREFDNIDEVAGSLILWRHKNNAKHHYIIQICPVLEKWILNLCAAEGIQIEQFGLSNSLEGLKEHTKSRASLFDEKLISLFREIDSKNNNSSIRKLKNWVRTLKDQNYNVDINQLKNG